MIELAKSDTVKFWCAQIDWYEGEYAKWEKRSKKIVKRYKDERSDSEARKSQFNILWSNVQTLAPALYDRAPTPNIDRRFQDDDKLGTVSSMVLERAVNYFVDSDEFNDVMKQLVLDRLLPGRGSAWVRYEPNFKDVEVQGPAEVQQEGVQTTDDQQDGEEAEPEQELYSEDVVLDYVHWTDFGHTYARTWQEVRAVWRKVPMSRRELVDRFGEIGKQVPMDTGRKEDKTPEDLKRATVYEIWDKTTKKAFWICKDYKDALDERQDPLGLKEFFPCPKPVYATLANDSLIPTPDYIQYQDQAKELDDLTGRINCIVKCLKVAGVYDASAQGLDRLLSEGNENILIPVEQWAVHSEKGGLKGTIEFMPLGDIILALKSLYEARNVAKQDLYEITGISDIIRGASNPNETLGAQELKGKYAGLRLDNMQKDVARFSRDVVRIFAEIIAENFSLETIKQISGFKLLTAQEKEMIQMQMQQAQQMGQEVPPMSDEMQELMDNPTWEEVMDLIGNETARCFRIDIETDSTVKVDQEAEKAARTEFLNAAGSFMQQAITMPPDLQPLVMEMLMFGIRGFKVGRELESTFDIAMKKVRAAAENPEPKPDPEAQKAQMEMQAMQAQTQMDMQKNNAEMQMKASEMQVEEQRNAAEIEKIRTQAAVDMQRGQFEVAKMDIQLQIEQLKLQTAIATANSKDEQDD